MTLSSVNTAAARTLTEMNTAEARKPHLTIARSETHDTLRNCVRRSLNDYFNQLDGEAVSELYPMVLAEMEIPLLEKVLEYTHAPKYQVLLPVEPEEEELPSRFPSKNNL